MCCVLSSILFIGPRAGLVVWYFLNPTRFGVVYNSLLIPILGTIFLPVTTLTYTFTYTRGPSGPIGLNWVWLALALIIDLSLYGGGAYSRQRR